MKFNTFCATTENMITNMPPQNLRKLNSEGVDSIMIVKAVQGYDGNPNSITCRIILTSKIIIKDYLTNDEIFNQDFSYSSTYRVQNLHSDTVKSENKSTDDLINQTYQNLIIQISQLK